MNDTLFENFDASHPERCPYCGGEAYCPTANNGFCEVQAGPHHCINCGATELHYEDRQKRTVIEERLGWSEPNNPAGGYTSAHVTFWRETDMGFGDHAWECAAPDCDAVWQFTADGPRENRVRYCPECGRYITAMEGLEGYADDHSDDA